MRSCHFAMSVILGLILPVLSVDSFASNWQQLLLNIAEVRENGLHKTIEPQQNKKDLVNTVTWWKMDKIHMPKVTTENYWQIWSMMILMKLSLLKVR